MENTSQDNELIDSFIGGNQDAFDALVTKYQDYVLNVVYALAGDIEQVDDIAQEVFIYVDKEEGNNAQRLLAENDSFSDRHSFC